MSIGAVNRVWCRVPPGRPEISIRPAFHLYLNSLIHAPPLRGIHHTEICTKRSFIIMHIAVVDVLSDYYGIIRHNKTLIHNAHLHVKKTSFAYYLDNSMHNQKPGLLSNSFPISVHNPNGISAPSSVAGGLLIETDRMMDKVVRAKITRNILINPPNSDAMTEPKKEPIPNPR